MHAESRASAARAVGVAASVVALGAAAACTSTTNTAKPPPGVSGAPHSASLTPSTSANAGASASARATNRAVAATEIKSDWTTFFDGETPKTRRVALLQNGQQFAPTLAQQATTPLAAEATARVTKVTQTSPTTATVKYSVQSGGKTVLSHQTGQAILQNGRWKVGDASFCGLLAIENDRDTALLPRRCRSLTTSPGATP